MPIITVYAHKGGQGVTTTAVTLALLHAHTHHHTLLIDTTGDQAALLNVTVENQPGYPDYVSRPGLTLDDITTPVTDYLDLTTTGAHIPGIHGSGAAAVHDGHSYGMITGALDAYDTVIIDCAPAAHPWIAYADHRILVTRPCYLALHRAIQQPRPDHLVVITEAGRALTPTDIQTALGTPITATVPYDPDIARTLDAGLLATRPPRALTRPLRPLLTATSRTRSSEVVA